MGEESDSLDAADDQRGADDAELDLPLAIESQRLEQCTFDDDRRAGPDAREALPPRDTLCRPTVPGVLCTRLQSQAINRIRETALASESWR